MSDQKQQTVGARMSPKLQQQYLEAMGIQGWQLRIQPVQAEPVQEQTTTLESSVAESVSGENVENNTPELSSDSLQVIIAQCTACELHQNRQHVIVAEGDASARFIFVMTAPSLNAESPQHLMAKEASNLFTKMLAAINLPREKIHLTSLLKCPVPEDRAPRTTELICCEGYLNQQIEQNEPELIIALGERAAQQLLVSKKPLDELREKTFQYQNTPVMAMPHPQDLLINPDDKRKAWNDLQRIQREYNV